MANVIPHVIQNLTIYPAVCQMERLTLVQKTTNTCSDLKVHLQCMQEKYFKKQCTGKSLSEALLFAEHGENMLCTKIDLNVRKNVCTQHDLPRFELGIFMY